MRINRVDINAKCEAGQRLICWFSCGAASAVAAYHALTYHSRSCPIEICYCDTSADEHPDNKRFREDVEDWLGRPITVLSSRDYTSIEEVFSHRKYMSGIKGAVCTVAMKKIPRFEFQQADDIHIFGYTCEETKRMKSFEANNPDMFVYWILEEAGITKADCFSILQKASIELPVMYRLGYRNNNCIGCVKATSAKYWANIRRDFPDVFARRAAQSRELGVKLTRYRGERIFLDMLPDDDYSAECLENISCGPECGLVER